MSPAPLGGTALFLFPFYGGGSKTTRKSCICPESHHRDQSPRISGSWARSGIGHSNTPLWVCNSFWGPSLPQQIQVGGTDSGEAEANPKKRHEMLEKQTKMTHIVGAIGGKRVIKFHFICPAHSRCSINVR